MEFIDSCCLAGILTVAAYSDCTEYRVGNFLIINGWSAGLLLRMHSSGVTGIAGWFAGAAFMLLLPSILYIFRMVGAGDIKLMSVIGGFTGAVFALKVFAAAVLIGGVLSVIRCIRYGFLLYRLHYFAEYVSELIKTRKVVPYYVKERDGETVVIPFSIAIALGFVVVRLGSCAIM